MSMGTVHVLHAIYHSGFSLTQLSEGVAGNQFNELIAMSAGYHNPQFTGILENKPEITFRTSQLRTFLGGMTPGPFAIDLSGSNTDLEWRKAVDLGTRNAIGSTVHIRTRLTQGLLYWRSISARQGEVAEADCRLSVTWD